MDFCVLEIQSWKVEKSLTGNNQSFLKILFVVFQDKMALKKGTNQVFFWYSEKKGFVKATELEENHPFSYTHYHITI